MKTDIPKFDKGGVLVVGDVMLDRYWKGSTDRISPEAPVPVVHVKEIEERPGGAGNVALNITALEGKAVLMGIIGTDEAGRSLELLLRKSGVDCRLHADPVVQTSTKLRILSRHQQLIRADFENRLDQVSFEYFFHTYKEVLCDVGTVVLSDYGKGTLCRVEELIRQAREKKRPVLIGPKGTDFSRYRGVTVITPNRAELEAVVGKCHTEESLVERTERLRNDLSLEALLVTRGEEGMTLVQRNHPPVHLPAQARDIYDVTGAGDTVIAVLATGIAAGSSLEHAMRTANVAAGIVVGKVGTATATVGELEYAMRKDENRIPLGRTCGKRPGGGCQYGQKQGRAYRNGRGRF